MDLRIITKFQDQNNFGQRLQNYALQQFLKKNFNANVISYELIEYIVTSEVHAKYYKKFHDFETQYMNVKKINSVDDIYREKDEVDYFIIGSDQVFQANWNYDHKDFFTIPQIESSKKLTYAASDGLDFYKNPAGKAKEFYDLILTIKQLSFREYDTYSTFCNNLSGNSEYSVNWNIDPTLLLDRHEYEAIECKPDIVEENEKFTVSYLLGKMNEYGYAPDEILSTIDSRTRNINITKCDLSPCEFLWLFDHCQKIYTTSFHGCVFGFLFNKKLEVKNTKDSRISSLCQMLNILDINNVDYMLAKKSLLIEQEKAIDYFCSAFSNENMN